MKYTIRINEDNKIIAINTRKPIKEYIKNVDGLTVGVTITYDIPEDTEEITKEVYDSLVSRFDLNYIKWVNSAVVEETQVDKDTRMLASQQNVDASLLEKLKEDLIRLSPYVVLTQAGNDLIT